MRRSTGAELGATRCYRGEEKPVLPATVPGTILEMPLPGAGSASHSRSDEGWCLLHEVAEVEARNAGKIATYDYLFLKSNGLAFFVDSYII